MAFYHTKKRFGPKLGYLSLPIYWIAFEQLHLHWFLTWPWLTLGNGFAQANHLVQWYEYTGFLGGSRLDVGGEYSGVSFAIKNSTLEVKNAGADRLAGQTIVNV